MNTKPHHKPVNSEPTQQGIDTTSQAYYDNTPHTRSDDKGTNTNTAAMKEGAPGEASSSTSSATATKGATHQVDTQTVIKSLRKKRKRFTIGLSVIAVLIGPLALVLATLMKNGTEAFAFSVLFMMSLGLLTSVLWFRHSGLSEEIAELESRVNPKGDS